MAESNWRKVALAVSFTTIVSEDAALTRTDNLIKEIEASEEPIGPAIRAIQDGEDQQRFMEHLKSRIAEHDRDIERMCNFHYQGFVDSIGELLKVRKHAEKLKEGVLSTNKALQRSGQPVIQQADELDKTRRTQRNIIATVENLQLCLPVLEMYCKLNEQMDNKRYYPALKTLEQLEHTYLPRVKRYRFCEEMAENIPKLREGIKDASMSDLKDFLESIRKHSDWIGEEAMKQVHRVISLEVIFLKRSGKFHSTKKIVVYTRPVINHDEPDEEDAQVKVGNDFGLSSVASTGNGRKWEDDRTDVAATGYDRNDDMVGGQVKDEAIRMEEDSNPFASELEDEANSPDVSTSYNPPQSNAEMTRVSLTREDSNPFFDESTDSISGDENNPFADDKDVGHNEENHLDDTNPFAEEEGDDDSEDVSNPFNENYSEAGPSGKRVLKLDTQFSLTLEGVTVDESSLEENEMLSPASTSHSSNPFDDDDDEEEEDATDGGTNPFGEDEDEDKPHSDDMTEVQRRSNIEQSVFHKNGHESTLIEADTNPFTEEIMEADEEVNAQDKVDFSPVYRCLHIYSVLGERDVFEAYYRKQRSKQSKLAIQPQGNMYESLEHYQKFFYQILGFFVVEDHIMNTTEGLVTREYLDELWNTSLAKITAVLRNNSAFCTDATLLLQVKDQIVLFSQTLNSYGFGTLPVYEFLFELKDQYNEILMKKWVQIFRSHSDPKSDIFDSDNYTAIVVQSEQEYNSLMRTFPFSDETVEKTSYPRRLPFSEFVPKVYHQIKEFIYACHKFSQDLHLAQTERDDMIRKSTNILLTRTLSGCLSELIKRDSLGLTELVQVTVNTIHLENACEYLEDFISNITGTTGDNIHAQGLQSTNIFRDARSEAEQEIYKRLNAKVDEFLELASYDWTLDESKGHASGYIQDVISFLEGSFKAFKHLPGKVAQTACLSTCKHLANSLMEFLLDDNVKFISMGAIQQFSLDVIQCELFANSEPVPGFREGALQMTFLELRQLLDLFMAWDWSSYLADYGQSTSKYSRVNPHTAIAILEKMKETEKKKTFLPTFKKNERDRKKLMDMVLKQLKALVTGPTSKAQAH